jgi:HAD superfamily hydrolase (TIGR01509 family)
VTDAVILDMDGLMLDTEPVSERCWKAAAREIGREIDDALFARKIGRTMPEDHALLRERFGAVFPAEALGRRARALFRATLEAEGVAHKPGLLDLLALLDLRRVPRAVATSSRLADARRQLACAGVLDRVHAVAGGDEVRAGKPAPDVFLLAAERLGIDPARCAVLEDSGPGIHAARAAGMTAILVPDGVEPLPDVRAAASVVVASLHEARDVLAGLLGGGAA